MAEDGEHAAADLHGRGAEDHAANLRRPRDAQQRRDRPAHAVPKEKQRFARLPSSDSLQERFHVIEIFIERSDQHALPFRAAVAAQVHRVHGVAAAAQVVDQSRVAAAMLAQSVDDGHRRYGFSFRQPPLLVQTQAVACGKAIFVVRHGLVSRFRYTTVSEASPA